jgi:hypothetical protein
MNFSDVLSVTGIYLALIGLLSTFFFVNLTQWISSINGLKLKWDKLKKLPQQDAYERGLECYKEANQFSSQWTLLTWIAVSIFLVLTFILQLIIISQQSCENQSTLYSFLFFPSSTFMLIYFIFSITMLVKGYSWVRKIINEFNAQYPS